MDSGKLGAVGFLAGRCPAGEFGAGAHHWAGGWPGIFALRGGTYWIFRDDSVPNVAALTAGRRLGLIQLVGGGSINLPE